MGGFRGRNVAISIALALGFQPFTSDRATAEALHMTSRIYRAGCAPVNILVSR